MPPAPPAKLVEQFRTWRLKPQVMVRELFGATPDPWQDKVLEVFPSNPRIAMKASKGPGKTCVLAWLAWNFLLTRPHPNIAATSISGDNLRDGLWKECAAWMQKSELLKQMFVWQTERIFAKDHPATWWMSARTWAKSADTTQLGNTLAGLHSDYIMFLIDESGSIPTPITLSAEAALASCKEGHILQAGNTTSLDGALYDACVNNKSLWHVITITGDPDNPLRSPRVSVEWAKQLIESYGRDSPFVKVMVLGEWPSANLNALLSIDDVRDAQARKYRQHDIDHAPRILGVDVAREGDDASVIFPRQGLVAFPPHVLRNVTGITGAGHISRICQDWDADAVFIDNTGGFGSAWIDVLATLNRSSIPVGFAERAQDRRYANRRAEMYFRLAEWVKAGGCLPDDPDLVGELTQTTYTFKGDALLLEPKAIIKEKLGRSPDKADALCFVADTLIQTPFGEVPIQDIHIGDEVVTPFGVTTVEKLWESVTDSLTTVKLSNGAQLVGRGAHKMFVWGKPPTRLDALSLTDRMEPYDPRRLWCWKALFIAARNSGFKALVDTTSPATRQRLSAFFIVVCGTSISVLFRKVATSITEMATGATTTSPTWSASTAAPTAGSICSNAWKTLSGEHRQNVRWPWPELRRQHGTHRRKVWNGTSATEQQSGRVAPAGTSCEYVRRAASSLAPPLEIELDSAQAPVCRGSPSSATSRIGAFAHTAVNRLWRIVTARRHVAPVYVRTESVPQTVVYNLTLREHNAYYANGVLAFNCLSFAETVAPKNRGIQLPRRRDEPYDIFAEFVR